MSEISEWESRQLARKLRIAALISLGRAEETKNLPPLENVSTPTFLPIAFYPAALPSAKGTKTGRVLSKVGARVGSDQERPQGETIIKTGTFHWLDRWKKIAIVVADGSGQPLNAKLPTNYPRVGGPLKDEQKVQIHTPANPS